MGVTTIRAFGAAPRLTGHSKTIVDANTRCFYTQYVQSQWVSYRLALLGSSIIFLAALLPVAMSQLAFRINVALAGVAISYALEVCNFLKHATRMTLELEKTFSGVERIMEYADTVPQEPRGGVDAPEGKWPLNGHIKVEKLSVRYRPGCRSPSPR